MKTQTMQIQKSKQISKGPVLVQKQRIQSNKGAEKAIIFDSGALISFSMNGITDILRKLKEKFSGKFLITSEVKQEVVDTPIKIKRFELEALKIKQLLDEGVLEMSSSMGIKDSDVTKRMNEIKNIANTSFSGRGRDINLLHIGESSCLALSRMLTEKGVRNIIAIDERTTRLLVEKPENLKRIFEEKMNTKVTIKNQNFKTFSGIKIVRSTELAYVAYKKGLVNLKNGNVLDALLYALKLKGAAISREEIEEAKKLR